MLTVSDDEDDLFEALKAGAQGYLLKKLKSDVFFEFIDGAARGEAPISPSMASKMLGEFGRTPVPEKSVGVASLTERELEVLELIARAAGNREIAEALFITERTVKFHTRNIIDKLHLKNRAQVIAYASRKGYGAPDTEQP
jgi:DNA-binding NarL/FixJ family response regulator